MSKRDTNKLRVLAVYNMILRGKRVSAAQIQRELDLRYDIQADRKTIYNDIWAIDQITPVDVKTGPKGGYCKLDVFGLCEEL